MNSIAKVSAAGALALGFGIAHASVKDPSSPGDVLLFAEVLNSGGTVVGSYAGDSGIVVGTTLANGTVGTLSKSADANLSTLLSLDTGSNTLEWAVEGAAVPLGSDGVFNAADKFVTTIGGGGNLAQLSLRTGNNASNWSGGLSTTTTTIYNITHANSIFATTTAAGGQFDTSAQSNIANWFSNGTATAQTGLGSTTLYGVTMGSASTSPVVVSALGTVTLSATGLSFAASSGGGGTTVPLPAAVWLLGSGLLGLAGVGRRKLIAA